MSAAALRGEMILPDHRVFRPATFNDTSDQGTVAGYLREMGLKTEQAKMAMKNAGRKTPSLTAGSSRSKLA